MFSEINICFSIIIIILLMMCAYSLSIGISLLKIPIGNIFFPLLCIHMALRAAERQRKRKKKLKNDPVKLTEVLRRDSERKNLTKDLTER